MLSVERRQVDIRFVVKLFLGFAPNMDIKRKPVKFGAFWFLNYKKSSFSNDNVCFIKEQYYFLL